MRILKAVSKVVLVAIVASILTTEGRPSRQGVGSECPRGTRNGPNGCVAVQIPPNAELDVFGHDWTCRRGFRQSGDHCIAVQIPENAEIDVFRHHWTCKRGYRQSADRCVAVQIPENAEVDVFGHDWTCKRGYRQSGDHCVALQIPANAELDVFGHDWTCKRGFKLVSGNCAAMSPEEFRESERARAEAARRVRSDLSACEIDGEPIRGERAKVVMKKSGCGDYFVADGPSGHYLLEWYGGYSPAPGDVIIGTINSYGFKDVCYPGHGKGRVWVDDYLLSKNSAIEKYLDKCQ